MPLELKGHHVSGFDDAVRLPNKHGEYELHVWDCPANETIFLPRTPGPPNRSADYYKRIKGYAGKRNRLLSLIFPLVSMFCIVSITP